MDKGIVPLEYPQVSTKTINKCVHEPVYFSKDRVTVKSDHTGDWMSEPDKTSVFLCGAIYYYKSYIIVYYLIGIIFQRL